MGKVVLREDDVVYVQENVLPSTQVLIAVDHIDWLELARQKYRLLNLVWEDDDDILWGLIHLIDVIQDQAEAAGHPVVFGKQAGEEDE